MEPLVDSFGWWSGYVFSENWVVNSVELEGLERVLRIVGTGGASLFVSLSEPGSLGEGLLNIYLDEKNLSYRMTYIESVQISGSGRGESEDVGGDGLLYGEVGLGEVDYWLLRYAYSLTDPILSGGMFSWVEHGLMEEMLIRRLWGDLLKGVSILSGYGALAMYGVGTYVGWLLPVAAGLDMLSTLSGIASTWLLRGRIDWYEVGWAGGSLLGGRLVGRAGRYLGRLTESDFLRRYVISHGNIGMGLMKEGLKRKREEGNVLGESEQRNQ